MADREKVLIGLECLITNETPCEGCPYYGSGHCMKNIAKDARELLKEQEPRVLTLEEVKRLQSLLDGAIWLEAYSGLFPALPEVALPNITYFVCIPLNGYRGWFENEWYGKTWRCWSAKPTVDQRKAVKWDDRV